MNIVKDPHFKALASISIFLVVASPVSSALGKNETNIPARSAVAETVHLSGTVSAGRLPAPCPSLPQTVPMFTTVGGVGVVSETPAI